MPTTGQLILLYVAITSFIAGGVTSFLKPAPDGRFLRIVLKSLRYWGLVFSVAAIVWHGIDRGNLEPVGDNFDALVWLGVLIAGFTAYVQATRPLAALDWFLMPVAVGLLVCAAVVGRADYRDYQQYVGRAWTTVHHLTSFGGAVFFAIAAAGGLMYVMASDRLRNKKPAVRYLGSLERLERLNMNAVTIGFALLTVGIITGAIEMVHQKMPTSTWKVVLAGCVWVIYAVVLHAPINPVFRGRRAAALSVLGFVLMIGVLVAVQFGGKN
jgi:ABC-type uncharacterized transport system permease subunit